MRSFRCLALLTLSGAEEYVELEETSSLLQSKVLLQRQDPLEPPSDESVERVESSALLQATAVLQRPAPPEPARRPAKASAAATRATAQADVIASLTQNQAGAFNSESSAPPNLAAAASAAAPSQEATASLLSRARSTASIFGLGQCDVDRTMQAKGAQHFNQAPQTSVVTGTEYQVASEDEFAILDKINEVRRAGFNCTDPENGKVHVFEPQCRNRDILFDCRLWFAAKQHAEDMGMRNYYAHETQLPFPSGSTESRETFDERASEYGFGVAAHFDMLMGVTADQEDSPEVIVQSWLQSYTQCMVLGTTDAHLLGFGKAPCQSESGRCVHRISGFTDGLMTRKRWFDFYKPSSYQLDTSCYPESRDRARR